MPSPAFRSMAPRNQTAISSAVYMAPRGEREPGIYCFSSVMSRELAPPTVAYVGWSILQAGRGVIFRRPSFFHPLRPFDVRIRAAAAHPAGGLRLVLRALRDARRPGGGGEGGAAAGGRAGGLARRGDVGELRGAALRRA